MGDLKLPPRAKGVNEPESAQEKVPVLIELNVLYPGGLDAVRAAFYKLWNPYVKRSGGSWPAELTSGDTVHPKVPKGLALIAPKLYQCVLSRTDLRDLVDEDRSNARDGGWPPIIFRAWPDYELEAQIDRSAPTVKADAAWRSYDASGRGIVWAVIDSGIDARHPHFSQLELAAECGQEDPKGLSSRLHRDFSGLVNPNNPARDNPPPSDSAPTDPTPIRLSALVDESGHGTHVAGIIAGCAPDDVEQVETSGPADVPGSATTKLTPHISQSRDPGPGGGFVSRARAGKLSGMAPVCELVSLKVMRENSQGQWVTSSSAVIRALTYLRTEVNVDPAVLRVHGVNMSLGCEWKPEQYAAGQSPLCQAVNQLVASGVVVVVSAGNKGARTAVGDSANTSAVMGSITEPAHAEDCIAVGSTHRDAPHAFGVTWTSGKGPTLDGRMKPDVVAPGEWIASAASGKVRTSAGFDPATPESDTAALLTYAEQSGTSMAAPHVSGVIAAFLSARPEFIGRPRQVKRFLTDSATDLGRERYAQGAGLVDLMRMLSNV